MARHDQKDPIKTVVCTNCQDDLCAFCIDVLRANYTDTALCNCQRTYHASTLQRVVERERAARRTAPSEPHITCPVCGKTSYHTEDVKTGYCGYCHDFTSKGSA